MPRHSATFTTQPTKPVRYEPNYDRLARCAMQRELVEYLEEKFAGSVITADEQREVTGVGNYVHFCIVIAHVNAVYWGKVVMPMLEHYGKTWDVDIKVTIAGGVEDKIITKVGIDISWNIPFRGLR